MISTHIGYSKNKDTRYSSTSGGVGSSMVNYLFEKNKIQTSVNFIYDEKSLQYEPKLIHTKEDYQITGSIYHEIDMFHFIKKNLHLIKGKICLFLLPCQVKPITYLLDKNKIPHFIIALTCSSQQSIDATYFLLKTQGIVKSDVCSIKYRGNGWPSGVSINLKDGSTHFISNNKSIWTQIFHSRLFIQKRCFKCKETISKSADICLADPWLKEFVEKEKIGQSIVVINTKDGVELLREAMEDGVVSMHEISREKVLKSQQTTIDRKNSYSRKKKRITFLIHLLYFPFYRSIVLNHLLLFKLHCKLIHKIERHI